MDDKRRAALEAEVHFHESKAKQAYAELHQDRPAEQEKLAGMPTEPSNMMGIAAGEAPYPHAREAFLRDINELEQRYLRNLTALGRLKIIVQGAPSYQLDIARQIHDISVELQERP